MQQNSIAKKEERAQAAGDAYRFRGMIENGCYFAVFFIESTYQLTGKMIKTYYFYAGTCSIPSYPRTVPFLPKPWRPKRHCGGIYTASRASNFETRPSRLIVFDVSLRSKSRRYHWIESGQPTRPWSWPSGGGSHGSSFLLICQGARVKIENSGEKIFTICIVPTYVGDFYTILKVELALVLLRGDTTKYNACYSARASRPPHC